MPARWVTLYVVHKDLGYTGWVFHSDDLPSLFPAFVFPKESAAFFEGAVMFGDVQVGDAEGNEATRPTPNEKS